MKKSDGHRCGMAFILMSLLFWTAGCKQPEAVKFLGIDQLSVETKSLSQSVLVARLALYNPNRMDVYAAKVQAVLYLNDTEITQYQSDSTIKLPARDTFFIPVQVRISNSALLGGALRSLAEGRAQYRVAGTLRGGTKSFKMTIPFDERGEVQF